MKLKLLWILFLFINQISYSQKADIEKIDNFITDFENQNQGIGSISIFKKGEEIYRKNFGQSYIKESSVDYTKKYQVGSSTKIFTAVLIFQLIENKQLKLDDKLSDFYPDIKNSNYITIENLLNHSSGLGSYTLKDGKRWLTEKVSDQQIMDLIKEQGSIFFPNTNMKYSNSAYYLLTKIIESKHKETYDIILKKHILEPLGLGQTKSVSSNPTNIYNSYHFTDDQWELVTEFDFKNVIGVGDIASTTTDLNKFISALFEGKLLNKNSLDLMKPILAKEEHGRGLMVFPVMKNKLYGHTGGTYGTSSFLGYDEKKDLSIALSLNGVRYSSKDFIKVVVSILYKIKITFPEFIK